MNSEELPDERPQRRREYSGAASTLGVAMLIVLAVGVGLWFFEFRSNGSSDGSGHPGLGIISLPAALNTTGKSPAAEVGRAAPDFKLELPSGQATTLDAYRGKYVLLNFWASWCGPCRSEAPILEKLTTADSANLVVLGVNQQEDVGAANQFRDDFQLTYATVMDFDGTVSDAYRLPGLPVTYLIDPNGVIRQIFLSRLTDDNITQLHSDGIF